MNAGVANRVDPFSGLRNALREVAMKCERWAGIPMPVDGERLVIEPRYPGAEELMRIGAAEAPPTERKFNKRNAFWSSYLRSEVRVWQDEHGRIDWGVIPGAHHFDHDLQTLGASVAWGVEQESHAIERLSTLLTDHSYKQYVLTGMFIESSARSRVMYVFRRLKPTVAVSQATGRIKILACLCMHPIGYYAHSWAGAMCPTDDVIAHLMLMRADEKMFWRRSGQHPPWRPEAGL